MDLAFNSLDELYKRIKPALNVKVKEINRIGFKNINEEDIWNFLKETKWSKSVDLLLYEMVNDIFNFNSIDLF